MSDISGQDIFRHENDPQMAIEGVRNWLVNNNFDLPVTNKIWIEYNRFKRNLQQKLKTHFTPDEIKKMPEGQYIRYVKDWLGKLN